MKVSHTAVLEVRMWVAVFGPGTRIRSGTWIGKSVLHVVRRVAVSRQMEDVLDGLTRAPLQQQGDDGKHENEESPGHASRSFRQPK